MALHRLILRLMSLCYVVFVVTACNPISLEPNASPTVHPAPQASPSPDSALQSLQHRSLHFPIVTSGAACPTSPEKKVHPKFGIAQGDGPAYATFGAETTASPVILTFADAQHFGVGADNQGWGGQKVLWFVNPSYQGLVLVRGQQLDGSHPMRFNRSLDRQLVLDTTQAFNTPWPNFATYTRLQAPGCYAYQVDGDSFSYVIVFQAVVQN